MTENEELSAKMIRAGVERLEQLMEAETGLSYTVEEVYRAMDAHRSPAWRDDIESAPRDGTRVLLYIFGLGIFCAYWEDGVWCADDNDHDYLPIRGYGGATGRDPTHWMPLPLPPEEGRG